MGFAVWFTYGGKESTKAPVYMDVKRYKRGLKQLARLCTGFILHWRRTSLHLFIPEATWTGYTLKQVRKGNKNIIVAGEIYYGYQPQTYKHNSVTVDIPENASCVVATNMGFSNSYAKGVVKLCKKYTDLPILSLVVGEKPYYMSSNKNNKTKQENRVICKRIEKRMTSNGVSGTVTITGDGSDGNYSPKITDNLCRSKWHKQEN